MLERVGQVGREVQALAVARDELLEPRLVDRDLAAAQALDLLGVDVDAPDLAAQLGEAGGRHQADVAGADDADGLAFALMQDGERLAGGRRCRAGLGADARQRPGDRAHLLLVSFCDSVLETQYAPRGVRQATSRSRSPS